MPKISKSIKAPKHKHTAGDHVPSPAIVGPSSAAPPVAAPAQPADPARRPSPVVETFSNVTPTHPPMNADRPNDLHFDGYDTDTAIPADAGAPNQPTGPTPEELAERFPFRLIVTYFVGTNEPFSASMDVAFEQIRTFGDYALIYQECQKLHPKRRITLWDWKILPK